MTHSRSSSGRSEQRSSASSCGSIGATAPGTYVENARRGGAVVERRARADEVRDVGDVHPGADAVGLAAERERVVEVLRRLGIDRVGDELAEIDAVASRPARGVVRLELDPRALLDEQRLEHVLDAVGRAEPTLHPGAAAPGSDEREVARRPLRRSPSAPARSARRA